MSMTVRSELLDEIWYMILNNFDGNEEEAVRWTKKPLVALGGMSVEQMINMGRVERLHAIIEQYIGWPESAEEEGE